MVIVGFCRRFASNESGAALVETVVVLNILVLVLIAFVEFSIALNQWNLAARATQVGARLAAVSNPVDSTLGSWTGLGDPTTNPQTPPFPGDPVQDSYNILCSGATAQCKLESGSYSGGTPTYDAAAMLTIVDGSTAGCDASGTRLGMCDFLPAITAQNVDVRYQFTGLGYAGRPAGPIPTITVSLRNVPIRFRFLDNWLGLDDVRLPAFATTIVGEDLSTGAP